MSRLLAASARAVFRLQERVKRHSTVARLHELEATQWWKSDALAALSVARLRSFLVDAGERVPYYRALYAAHRFDPRAVQSVDALAALPFLTKPVIRQNVEALKASGAPWLQRYTTGGSSGEPLVFFMGRDRVSHDVAAKWRATRWWNVDIGDREIVVWGSPVELNAQDRLRRLRDAMMRTTLLPAFEMSAAKLDAFVERIRSFRPRMVFGYPSALALIAEHAAARGRRLDDVGVGVVFVTSEILYEHQRARIAGVFGAPVANGYGARDAGFIAHECPHGGMHVSAEDVIVEIVRADGQRAAAGEEGEIVVTHLATRDFPFIRYRTGDVAALETSACACGRGLPLLTRLQGRSTDFIVAKDGTIMHGLALIYVLRELSEVASFKIVQETVERMRVLVVPAAGWSEATRDRIVGGLRERLGDIVVEIEEVAAIPPERSGKFRYVVSNVRSRVLA